MFELFITAYVVSITGLCIYLLFEASQHKRVVESHKVNAVVMEGQLKQLRKALERSMNNDYRDPLTKRFISKKEWLKTIGVAL